jgi:hypothetical protein
VRKYHQLTGELAQVYGPKGKVYALAWRDITDMTGDVVIRSRGPGRYALCEELDAAYVVSTSVKPGRGRLA